MHSNKATWLHSKRFTATQKHQKERLTATQWFGKMATSKTNKLDRSYTGYRKLTLGSVEVEGTKRNGKVHTP
jgi:hypothetical protein